MAKLLAYLQQASHLATYFGHLVKMTMCLLPVNLRLRLKVMKIKISICHTRMTGYFAHIQDV